MKSSENIKKEKNTTLSICKNYLETLEFGPVSTPKPKTRHPSPSSPKSKHMQKPTASFLPVEDSPNRRRIARVSPNPRRTRHARGLGAPPFARPRLLGGVRGPAGRSTTPTPSRSRHHQSAPTPARGAQRGAQAGGRPTHLPRISTLRQSYIFFTK